MNNPTPSLLSSGGAHGATVLPPLQWGWLALVAGLHVAGLAWLGLGDEPLTQARPAESVVSVQLLTPPVAQPTATPSLPSRPAQEPVKPKPSAQAPKPRPLPPPQHARPAATAASHAPAVPRQAPEPAAVASAPEDHAARPAGESAPDPATEVQPPADQAPAPTASAVAATSQQQAETLAPARYDADYLHNPPPGYPAAARRRGEEGQVTLRVHVLASGRAAEIEIAESSSHPRLDRAARDAVAHWRFEPARRGSQPVDSWLRVPIVFRLEGR